MTENMDIDCIDYPSQEWIDKRIAGAKSIEGYNLFMIWSIQNKRAKITEIAQIWMRLPQAIKDRWNNMIPENCRNNTTSLQEETSE